MEKKFVITINRKCGSGGGTVGRRVAELLGVRFYDKALIDLSEEPEERRDMLRRADDRIKNAVFSRVSKGEFDGVLVAPDSPDRAAHDELFGCQAQVIHQLAEQESCVVVGRCADYILRDLPHTVNLFFTADEPDCIRNECRRLDIPRKQAQDRIRKVNAHRRAYYTYHTGAEWDDPQRYDMVIDTTDKSFDECAAIIIDYISGLQYEED